MPFNLYYVNATRHELVPTAYSLDESADLEVRMATILRLLQKPSEDDTYTTPFPKNVGIINYSMDGNTLLFNFDSSYLALSSTTEVFLRASIVKTFTQLNEISAVEIRVENQPLTLPSGVVLGPQKGSDYVDILGNGLNDYTLLPITLYYADPSGNYLVPVSKDLLCPANITREQIIMEELLKDPNRENFKNAFSTETKCLSVTTKDGICHINLSREFNKEIPVNIPELSVYSIVNSLTELTGISAVQISIDGSSNVTFADKISLVKPFYRSLDYLNMPTEEEQ